jgi:hypothetical protein
MALALWFFTARDDATTSGPPVAVPGVAAKVPETYASDVGRGNVVLEVRRGDPGLVEHFAADVAGPDDPALRSAGQAIVVDSQADVAEPEIQCTGHAGRTIPCPPRVDLVAWAPGRRLAVSTVDDPALRAFVEYWLGRSG